MKSNNEKCYIVNIYWLAHPRQVKYIFATNESQAKMKAVAESGKSELELYDSQKTSAKLLDGVKR